MTATPFVSIKGYAAVFDQIALQDEGYICIGRGALSAALARPLDVRVQWDFA